MAIVLLALWLAVYRVGGICESTLRALGYSCQTEFNAGAAAAINVILNLLLIPGFKPLGVPKLEILGAAIAMTVLYATLSLLIGVELYLALGRIPALRVIPGPLAIALVLSAGLFATYDLIPGMFLWMAATAGVSAAVYWSAFLFIKRLNSQEFVTKSM
jgi:hypothetical protein